MNKVKLLREQKDISQKILSEQTGISLSTIRKYEQNQREINGASGDILFKLSKALNCSIEDLLEQEKINSAYSNIANNSRIENMTFGNSINNNTGNVIIGSNINTGRTKRKK